MPSPLRVFKEDPNKMKRGKGIYYKRGKSFKPKVNFKWFEGSYFSKYDIGPNSKDSKIKAKGWRISKVGVDMKGKASSISHAGDGRKTR